MYSYVSSQISHSSTQELPQAAKEEILTIIYPKVRLQSSLIEIAKKIDKARVVRNIRRLLISFTWVLERSITDSRERDAIIIHERHAPWFANRLFDLSNPTRDSI